MVHDAPNLGVQTIGDAAGGERRSGRLERRRQREERRRETVSNKVMGRATKRRDGVRLKTILNTRHKDRTPTNSVLIDFHLIYSNKTKTAKGVKQSEDDFHISVHCAAVNYTSDIRICICAEHHRNQDI